MAGRSGGRRQGMGGRHLPHPGLCLFTFGQSEWWECKSFLCASIPGSVHVSPAGCRSTVTEPSVQQHPEGHQLQLPMDADGSQALSAWVHHSSGLSRKMCWGTSKEPLTNGVKPILSNKSI